MHFGYFPSRIFLVFCGYLIQNIWNPDIFEFAILGGGPILLYYLQTVNPGTENVYLEYFQIGW